MKRTQTTICDAPFMHHRLRQLSLKIPLLIYCCLVFSVAEAAFTVNAVSVSSAQTGTLTYGTAGSVDYTITLGMVAGAASSTDLTLNWTAPT